MTSRPLPTTSRKRSGRLLKAKQAHDDVVAAAYRAQGDALLIESQAKMRLADEYDDAQERGEVQSPGGDRISIVPDENIAPATVTDIGLTRKDVFEARRLRDAEDADPGIIRRAVNDRIAGGYEPTKSAVREAVRDALSFATERDAENWFRSRQAKKTEAKALARSEKERSLANATLVASRQIGHQLYGVIYADPPWRFEPYSRETGMDRAPENHYPTETTEAIARMVVPAADDAVLFLWGTAPMLPDALVVLNEWGFAYKSHVVWLKDRIGTGYWARNKHEILLIGTRGSVPAPSPGTQFTSVVEAPVGRHSEKPSVFAELIETMFPTMSKLEMFCRSTRPGWDVWGNQSEDAA